MSIRQVMEAIVSVLGDRPSAFRFILQHGREWTVTPDTFRGRRALPHTCFMTATHMAQAGIGTYVEGFASCAGVPIEHAWIVNDAGEVIDPVWPEDPEAEYFGVPFELECLLALTLESDHYGLLGFLSSRRVFTLQPHEFIPARFAR